METRACGSSGLVLPLLGVGCWAYGGGNYWGAQAQEDVNAVVGRAIDLGCGFFDTAEGYNEGRSEEALGLALGGRRSRALIGTKISPVNFKPGRVTEHCQARLRRLGTDYIDLYMIHWPVNPGAPGQEAGGEASGVTAFARGSELEDALDEFAGLQRKGLVRHLGLSNYGTAQLREILATQVPFAANQLPYSLITRAIEFEVLPYCSSQGVGILAYMPLMQGLLTGKYGSADEMPPSRTRTRHFSGDRPEARHGEQGAETGTFEALAALNKVARREGLAMADLALAWAGARQGIASVITGARDLSQLEANHRALASGIADSLVDELNGITEALKERLGRNIDIFQGTAGSRSR